MHSVYTLYLPLVYHARTTHPHAHTHRDTQRFTEVYRDTQIRTHPHAHAHRVREAQTHILLSGAHNIHTHTHTLPPRLHRGTHRSIQRFTEAHSHTLLGVSIRHIPTNLLLFCFTYTIQIVNYMCIWYIHSYILFSSIDFYIPIV